MFAQLRQDLDNGNIAGVKQCVSDLLAQGTSAKDILDNGLIAAMEEVGKRFKANEIFIPEVLIAARAMQEGLHILEPLLAKEGVVPRAKVVIGTVKGDLHDIGKNIVAMMLKGAGFQVIDLGIDVPKEKFIETLEREGAKILAMSSLLTTSMPSMKDTIETLKKKGIQIRTMIGGAPVTQEYADKIGADAYGRDAATAVELAKNFTEKTTRHCEAP